MQQIEKSKVNGRIYLTPARKQHKTIDGHEKSKNEVSNPADSTFKKPLIIETPSTQLQTSIHNQKQSNGIQETRHMKLEEDNQIDKTKIRLFRQNTYSRKKQLVPDFQSKQSHLKISRSASKRKKGLRLLKNLLKQSSIQRPQIEQNFKKHLFKQEISQSVQIQEYVENERNQPLNKKNIKQFKQSDFFISFVEREVQSCYCKHFFTKIYRKYVKQKEVDKFNFGLIMEKQQLISDLVKDRHLVQNIWVEICHFIGELNIQNLQMGIVFAFLVSVQGHPIQEIKLFNYLETLLDTKNENILIKTQQMVYKHFQRKRQMFQIKRLSTPKKQ